MKEQDYTATITVDGTPEAAFRNINEVKKWWTEDLKGSSEKVNDEFTVRFGDVHVSTQKLIELIPNQKIVWFVTDSKLNFTKDEQEWTNTKISFELFRLNNKTEIKFTHYGLNPTIECYTMCIQGWDQYFKQSLFKFLAEGKGLPGTK